ncbi:hypothetical protein [Nonomuraea turcica]|uniref:hypothetical protein n=1 Tax=Nonomuraea sp. G32 TaxID=3067274 RepID=UPI00273C9947|nr:hypothetical protein [Nonomuraea sp. G32]MDP4508336.1 hypothetical protein [Nonomuraea sp. G32]
MRQRTGTIFIVIAAALTMIGTLIHVFPPHLTVVTVFLGLAGVLCYTVGVALFVGWPRQVLVRPVASMVIVVLACGMWGAFMGVAPVTGGTVALAVLGDRQACAVTEVDTETTRARGGRMRTTYVHTVRCSDARIHEIRTGWEERHGEGSPAEVVADSNGLLTARFVAGAYQWTGVGVFAMLVLCVFVLPLFARRVAPPPPPSAPGGFFPQPSPWAAQPRRY